MTSPVVTGSPLTETRQSVTRDETIAAIMAETQCELSLADATIDWIDGFVQAARKSGYKTQFPTDQQMFSPEYGVFDQIMQHAAVADPGSAAAAVNTLLLDRSRGEVAILHDNESQPGGQTAYCVVKVQLAQMQNG